MSEQQSNNGTNDGDNNNRVAFSYRRFSSPAQKDGDSFARQTARAEEWCAANGYALSTATFEDLGVSAFKEKNAEVGALNAFNTAVDNGSVPQGSTLLVENLDRLSRQHWQRGLGLLQDIVASGVNLVTLSDGKMFRANEEIDFGDGIMILVGFQRANEESLTKSKRLKSAWNANTAKTVARERLRTSSVPSWIRLEGTLHDGRFEIIPEKAEVVAEIFTRWADGQGISTIAKDLEKRGVPSLRRGQWREQNVRQLINSEAAYGTLEIGRNMSDEESKALSSKGAAGFPTLPVGQYYKNRRVILERLKGYYPRVVDEDIERRVRFRLEQRRVSSATVSYASAYSGTSRVTHGSLTGVIRDSEGLRGKVKRFSNTATKEGARYYVGAPPSYKYIGTVEDIDQVLVDYWPDIVKAYEVDTTAETENAGAIIRH